MCTRVGVQSGRRLDICYKSRSPAVWERAVLKLSFKMQRFRLRDFGFLQFGASMKTLD